MRVTIKKLVDELFNKNSRKEKFSFAHENYTMADVYDAEKLVVGKFKYISNDVTEFGPMVKKTSQNYIFEPIVME